MSWTDDTRCLYCEGRLPLYRKITHGQFCSSAHRKAYWQEQERLAVERLHQTHHSLRAYRSQAQADAPEPEPVPMVVAAPPELQPIPLLEAPEAIPAVLSLLAPELLPSSGSSPALIAPNPVVYEIPWQPLPPSSVVKVPETSAFPEGHPVAGWARLAPQPWTSQSVLGESGGVEESAVALSHPQSANPAVRIQAGGIVELPLTLGRKAPGTVAPIGSSLQALTIELPPVIDVAFEVQPQSDVLIQLLDQQIPRPDRLHALSQFAAHQSELPIAGSLQEQFDAPASTILPVAALSPVVPDHHLSVAAMLALPARVEPSLGNIVSQAAISEIPVIPQGIGISVVATPAVEQSAYQVGTAGLESLPSRLLKPAQGVFAQATDLTALDLSTGVSSDIVFPSFVPGPKATAVPLPTGILPLTFSKRKVDAPRPEPIVRLIPQAAEPHPVLPHSALEPMDRKPPEDALRTKGTGLGSMIHGEGLKMLEPAWAHATGFWQHAPRDLKLLLFAIPALLALVFHPGLPRVAFAAPQSSGRFAGNFQRVLNDQWVNVRQSLGNRAAVALDEDFRSGLDNWTSPGDSTTEWSFDSTGFVRPGPLALYRPSIHLADYQTQFMGVIDKKALSWVVRAADFENFYVVKLSVVKPGPLPAIGLTRYAVIGGKAQDRHDVNIPISARADTIYRVRMDVQGSNFSVEVQGQMADSWTETRLPRGGVGFFTAHGEESRVRWVQITHQYDMLGRLCAYLAPYDTTNGSWQP